MPFIVARIGMAKGQSPEDIPPRAYNVPHHFIQVGVEERFGVQQDFSLYTIMDKGTVEDALYGSETKASLIALADKLDIPIKKDKGKIEIASQLAIALTKPFSDIEKANVSEKLDKLKKGYPSSSSPPLPEYSYGDDIYVAFFKQMPMSDLPYLSGWCLASMADDTKAVMEINLMIAEKGSDVLKAQITRMTYLEDKNGLIEFVGHAFNFINREKGEDTKKNKEIITEDIYLCEKDETNLGKLKLSMDASLAKVIWTIHYGKKAIGKDIYDHLTESYPLTRNGISIKWSTASGSSLLQDYDNLWSYFRNNQGEVQMLYLHLKVQGGGLVKKSVQRKKFAQHLKTSNAENTERLQKAKHMQGIPAFCSIQKMLNDAMAIAETDPKSVIETLAQNSSIERLDDAIQALSAGENSVQGRLKKCAQHLFGSEMSEIIQMREEATALIDTSSMVLHYIFTQLTISEQGFNIGKLKQKLVEMKAYKSGAASVQTDAML